MSRYSFLKAEFAPLIGKILRQDHTAKAVFGYDLNKSTHEKIFDDFARRLDPTHDRSGAPFKYIAWACRNFVATPVLAEDIYKVHDNLRDFDAWSGLLARDGQINQIVKVTSFTQLQDILQPYQHAREEKRLERQRRLMNEEQQRAIMAETTVVYSGAEGKIIIPHTMASSQYWGAQTKWCISAAHGDNRFDHYNSAHPIFIYLPNVSSGERALWEDYQSFKFAAVGQGLYDEKDHSSLKAVPHALKKLAQAAAQSLSGPARDFFDQHAGSGNIFQLSHDYLEISQQQEKRQENPLWEERCDTILHLDATVPLTEADLLNDRSFVVFLVKKWGWPLRRMPDHYRDDPEIVLAAMKNNGYFECASDRLRNDKNFVMQVVKICPNHLEYASTKLQADRDVLLAALEGDSVFSPMRYTYPSQEQVKLLRYVFNKHVLPKFSLSPILNDDRDIAIIAIKKNKNAFEYLSPRLRDDRTLLLMTKCSQYKHASRRLRSDRALLRLALTCDVRNFEYAPKHMRENKKLILELVKDYPEILEFVPKRYVYRDRDFMLAAVKQNGKALNYARKIGFFSCEYFFHDDREIVSAAVSSCGEVLRGLSTTLKDDAEIRKLAIEQDYSALFDPKKLDPLYYDRDLAVRAVQKNGKNLDYMTGIFNADREIIKLAIINTPQAWQHVAKSWLSNPAFLVDTADALSTLGRSSEVTPYLRHCRPLWGNIRQFTDRHAARSAMNSQQQEQPYRFNKGIEI